MKQRSSRNRFKQGVYYDDNLPDRVLNVFKSVNLLGGWDGASSGAPFRRPDTYQSILDGKNLRRVVYINGQVTPLIDGFTIKNGNASGWATNCSGSNANGCGGGIFVYQADARIINNKILDNTANNFANQSGYGGGIHLEATSGAVIRDNLIQGNRANNPVDGGGGGGGLSIYGAAQDFPRVNNNLFINNYGLMAGGLLSVLQPNPVIYNNTFDNNSASGAAALGVFGEGTITKNRFQNHQGTETVYLGTFSGTFEENTLIGNNASIGVHLTYESPPFPPGIEHQFSKFPGRRSGFQGPRGQDLVSIESMKMESFVASPCDGIVADVKVQPGQAVESGDVLVTFQT